MWARGLWFLCSNEEDRDPRDDLSLELSRVLRDFNVNVGRAVKLILQGANPNTESVSGRSLLQLAAVTYPEWVPLLLYLGANPKRLDANHRDAFTNCFQAHTNAYFKAEALLAIMQYDVGVSEATRQVFHNWLISRFPIVTTTLQAFCIREKKWHNANYVYTHLTPVTLRLAIYYEAVRHSQRLEIVRKLMVLFMQGGLYRVPKELVITLFQLTAGAWFTKEEVLKLINFISDNQETIRGYLKNFDGMQWIYSPEANTPFALQPPFAKLLYEYQVQKRMKGSDPVSQEDKYRHFRQCNQASLFKSPLNQLAFQERWQQSDWIKANPKKRGIP